MKSCSTLKNLEQFGIKVLTGEADALGFRILCDLDEQGVQVFKECFGIPICGLADVAGRNTGLADNWNLGSIASVMLTGYDVVPLAIMGFYLQGYNVIVTDDTVYALEADETIYYHEERDCYVYGKTNSKLSEVCWPKVYGQIRRIIWQRKSDGQIVQGTRNVHQMSGRVS